jgi:undecaprenol kinase/diacylglycerol kinase (ATP)
MHKKVTETNSGNTDDRRGFIKSASYAIEGLKLFFVSERNGKIQAVIAIVVLVAGLLLSIAKIEWLVIMIFTALVLSLEMFNSALEKLCDKINPEKDPQIKIIKDMAAGAVLWSSILSVVAGICIFIPKIIKLL